MRWEGEGDGESSDDSTVAFLHDLWMDGRLLFELPPWEGSPPPRSGVPMWGGSRKTQQHWSTIFQKAISIISRASAGSKDAGWSRQPLYPAPPLPPGPRRVDSPAEPTHPLIRPPPRKGGSDLKKKPEESGIRRLKFFIEWRPIEDGC